MKLASLAVCALGGILLLQAGCNSFDVSFGGPNGAGSVRVLDGAPEVVALNLQDSLKKRGLQATIVPGKDTVVVESKTGGGLQFALLLKSQRGADGREQTHVAVEWLGGKDGVIEAAVFAEIDRNVKK